MGWEQVVNAGAGATVSAGGGGNPYVVAAALAWLAGDFLYNYFTTGDTPKPNPTREFQIPTTEAGSVYPLIYGRVKISAPILAWVGVPLATANTIPTNKWDFMYQLDMLFALGIPPENCQMALHQFWIGDQFAVLSQFSPGFPDTGQGGIPSPLQLYEASVISFYAAGDPNGQKGGSIQLLDGRDTQTLVDGVGSPTNYIGLKMIRNGQAAANIPGYRGLASVFCFEVDSGPLDSQRQGWRVGSTPTVDSLQMEVTCAFSSGDYPIGDDLNPVSVILDLLTGTRGKLGIPISRIDGSSFTAAQKVCQNEGNGYSRVFTDAQTAADMISGILAQIDGIMYEDPRDGQIHIRLIRADYSPNDCLRINPTNCESLDQFSTTNWTDVMNRVKVSYTNRANAYRTDTTTAFNQANAVGQGGEVREVVLAYPGCCIKDNADNIASRELQSRSRPLSKCRAIVNKTFQNVKPGDPVIVDWPVSNISSIVFRVVNATRDVLADGKVSLSLVQEYLYQWRHGRPLPPTPIVLTGPYGG